MAVKSVTPANVLSSVNASSIQRANAGAAITAGQVIYKDPTLQTMFPAAANAATIQTIAGVALNNAATGQPVNWTNLDPSFTPGFTTSIGETLYLSETAGSVCPYADLTTGDNPVVIFVGNGTATSVLSIVSAGVKK